VVAVAPGRVNLIGDHTDYAGGLALPMAIDRAVVVTGVRGGDRIRLVSEAFPDPVDVRLGDPVAAASGWGRYVAAVAAVVAGAGGLGAARGLVGTVASDVPIGAGLSSSAALEVAVALALGAEGSPRELALACQRAEHAATGVACGILDQLTITSARAGTAMVMDCATLEVRHVPLPDDGVFVVVPSGVQRTLAETEYGTRRREVEASMARIGPLRDADPAALASLPAPLDARARHVASECARVEELAAALAAGDLAAAGAAMARSHASLRDDFAASTPRVDALVARLCALEGVHGARMTGGGFGGCVVALCRPDVSIPDGWVVRAAAAASARDA
jgi:galactokinase